MPSTSSRSSTEPVSAAEVASRDDDVTMMIRTSLWSVIEGMSTPSTDFANATTQQAVTALHIRADDCPVQLQGVVHGINYSAWPCEVREYYVSKLGVAYHMTEFVLKGTMVNIILGIIFNVLNVICLYRLTSRSTYYIYLLAVAAGDLSNILLNFAVGIIRGSFPAVDEWFLNSPALCGIHSYLVDFVCLIPVWMVALVGGLKMATLIWPLKTPVLTTARRARISIGVTVALICLWCLYKIPSGGFETSSAFGYKACRDITLPNMVFASTLMMSIVPAAVVLIINLVILIKIRESRRKRDAMATSKAETEARKKHAHTTRLVLVVATAFVVLVAPPRVFNLLTTVIEQVPLTTYEDKVFWLKVGIDMRYVRQFLFVVYQLNFNTNFILYLCTDQQFKKVLLNLFCPCWRRQEPERPIHSGTHSSASVSASKASLSTVM